MISVIVKFSVLPIPIALTLQLEETFAICITVEHYLAGLVILDLTLTKLALLQPLIASMECSTLISTKQMEPTGTSTPEFFSRL